MKKYWNFYDWFGGCVWSAPYILGDSSHSLMTWWYDWIKDEEYQPEVCLILLEDHDATNEEES